MTCTRWWTETDGGLSTVLRECLTAAVAAPSVHNTQPWLFRPTAAGVDVYIDRSRRLPVIDPRDRELLMSVGAAVLNLRVAILSHGRVPVQELMPSPDEPDLMARITLGPAATPPETARLLATAIPQRHTNRRPFADLPVPEDVLGELVKAAETEGALLRHAERNVREAALGLVRQAETRWREEPTYWAELAKWTVDTPGRQDGVPPAAFGPWSAMEVVPVRDFGLVQPARGRHATDFESAPTIAVLYTLGDAPVDWLRAGEALERTLLTATVRGVAATPMTQPLEIPELRAMMPDPGDGRSPQAIIRFGYGPPGTPSPRRPLEEFLVRSAPAGGVTLGRPGADAEH